MTAKLDHPQNLLSQLAWQVEMGADEALLDQPGAGDQFTLRDFPTRPNSPHPADAPAQTTSFRSPSPAQPNVNNQAASAAAPPVSPQAPSTQLATPDLSAITSLGQLRESLADFDQCALRNTASNLVFSDGNPGAKLMVVGEVPGREEDRVGLPLVGSAGQLFDRMLASIGLSRADIYITSLLPWRPPGNRTPTPEEMALLLPWLQRHIQLADPDVLVLFGGGPAKALIPGNQSILKARGKWVDVDYGDGRARPTLATLHPSFLIRSPAQKRLAFADLVALAAKLG